MSLTTQKLNELSFSDHLYKGFDNAEPDIVFTRLGVQVELWDNGIGVHLVKLTSHDSSNFFLKGL